MIDIIQRIDNGQVMLILRIELDEFAFDLFVLECHGR